MEERVIPTSSPLLEGGELFSYERKGPIIGGVRPSGRLNGCLIFGSEPGGLSAVLWVN
ncbi:hypothetical protein [Sphingomonas prati]|uniref:hypothetical protein n=1 Tax=Sphingomonas prati TaxID=1843237 RepID=UPI0018E0283D|nr:hypothetical protein [Sphingomonas prati]